MPPIKENIPPIMDPINPKIAPMIPPIRPKTPPTNPKKTGIKNRQQKKMMKKVIVFAIENYFGNS